MGSDGHLEGLEEMTAKVKAILEGVIPATTEVLREQAADIEQVAADRAPVDTGALRGSSTSEIEQTGEQIVAAVKFHEDYAARQHEHMEYNHPKGGEAKYLEKTMLEKAEQVFNGVADALKELFGG